MSQSFIQVASQVFTMIQSGILSNKRQTYKKLQIMIKKKRYSKVSSLYNTQSPEGDHKNKYAILE